MFWVKENSFTTFPPNVASKQQSSNPSKNKKNMENSLESLKLLPQAHQKQQFDFFRKKLFWELAELCESSLEVDDGLRLNAFCWFKVVKTFFLSIKFL